MPTPIVTDGSTERVTHAPKVVSPTGAQAFGERAARLEQLARDHPLGAYLGLMARVCRAQADTYPARTASELGDAARAASRAYGMPPFAAQSHERDAQWRDDLATLSLDLLVDERGFQRSGPNFLLHPGSG